MKPESCKKCSLYGQLRCFGRGKKFEPTIAFVTESPKLQEVIKGEVLSGVDGSLIDAVLGAIGVSPKDAYYTTGIKCPVGQTVKVGDMEACKGSLFEELKAVQPKVVVAMGTTVMRMLFGEVLSITEQRGGPRWSDEFNCYIVPTYQPGAVWRTPDWFPEFAQDIKKAVRTIDYPKGGLPKPDINLTVYDQLDQKEAALEVISLLESGMLIEDGLLACDIETCGFDYFNDDVLDIGFAPTATTQIVFSVPLLEDDEIQDAINMIFKRCPATLGWQNGKFDCQYLKADMDPKVFGRKKNVYLPDARNDFDTMLAHFEIDERSGTHGLKVWAKEMFNAPDWEAGIKKFLPNKDASYSLIPKHYRHNYLAHDVYYTRKGMEEFPGLMAEEGTRECFDKVLMPISNALTDIELRGVQLDVARMQVMYDEAVPEIEKARQLLESEAIKIGWSPQAYVAMKDAEKLAAWKVEVIKDPTKKPPGKTEVPKQLNPKSSPQMQWVAYDLCKTPLFEGKKTCSKDAVELYQHRHPFWKALAAYKEIADLFGIYIKGMLERVDPDNRIRPDFYLTGTVTGRISCHDPNLQNLPRKSIVKDFFVANNSYLECYEEDREETVIVNCDYKTLEVVVAAILSNDPVMLRPFIAGEDYHTTTMQGVFKAQLKVLERFAATADYGGFRQFVGNSMYMEIRHKTHEMCDEKADPVLIYDFIVDYMRFLTKFITFGIMYGRKAPSLAYGELQCTVAEAQKYIDNFLITYPDFWRWQKRMQQQAKEQGFVETLFHHKRRWHLTTNDTLYKLENQAVNTPIQGSAAQFCLIKVAEMHELLKANGMGWVLFTVHDSIVYEIKVRHLQQALTLIRDTMESPPFETDVPFKIDLEVGPTYKKVEAVVQKEDGTWGPKKADKCTDWLLKTMQH